MCGPRHLTSGHRHRLEWQYPDRLTKSSLTPLNLCKGVGFEALDAVRLHLSSCQP